MSKPVIAIDIDDVIASSTESLRLLVNERLGVSLSQKDYYIEADYWGYYERVWDEHGLSGRVAYGDLQTDMAVDQSHVPLLPGVSFAIAELSKQFDIVIITARDLAWEQATLAWLKQNFGDVFSGVHFAGNKHRKNDMTKGELCKEIGACLLIDDNTDHCRSALDAGIDAVLFGDYGWHAQKKDGLHNCIDWPAVTEYIDGKYGKTVQAAG